MPTNEDLNKLETFYKNNIEKRLSDFNRAKIICNTFWTCFFGALLIVPIGAIISGIKFSILPLLLSILYIFIFILLIYPTLNHYDKKNSLKILNKGDKYHLPQSADKEIKHIIMTDFLELFGSFKWQPTKMSKYILDFIRQSKILNNSIKIVDNYIEGHYQGIRIKILEIDTSIFKLKYISTVITVYFVFITLICSILSMVFNTHIAFNIFFGTILIVLASIILFFIQYFSKKRFKGVLVVLDMNKKSNGQTLIYENSDIGDLITIQKNKFEKVELEDVNFAKTYTVYSTDQIEARYILTTAFIERIQAIKHIFNAKYVRASFLDNRVVLAINTEKDMFNFAPRYRQIDYKTFLDAYCEISTILKLIQVLNLQSKTKL